MLAVGTSKLLLRTSPVNYWHLRSAVRILENGGIICYPTEGCYGLGCNPYDGQTVIRLLDIKHRPLSMGLVLIASNFNQLEPLLAPLPKQRLAQVQATWPGPVTWSWPCVPEAPKWLTGDHETLAVRITAHPLANALCKAFDGPLISTSANISGHPPARTALRVHHIFNQRVDYILHGELSGRKRPTEIRDALTGRALRRG